jgi:hypothetical protein
MICTFQTPHANVGTLWFHHEDNNIVKEGTFLFTQDSRGIFNSPVLVETTTAFLGQVLGPDIDQSTWAMGCFNVSDGTNNDNWWCFQDGDGFNNFLLVDF